MTRFYFERISNGQTPVMEAEEQLYVTLCS